MKLIYKMFILEYSIYARREIEGCHAACQRYTLGGKRYPLVISTLPCANAEW